jgi:uncharacterized protein
LFRCSAIIKVISKVFALLFILYLIVGVSALRYAIPFLLFPTVELKTKTTETKLVTIGSPSMEVISRVYTAKGDRCLFFFSGQHGGASRYESEILTYELKEKINVVILSYPGQDGAKGRVREFSKFVELITEIVRTNEDLLNCQRSVFYGRSLGSIVAAHVAEKLNPKGLILESSPISLSKSLINKVSSKWYLYPFQLLPIKSLLPYNFELESILNKIGNLEVVIFQGEKDEITPLYDIQALTQKYKVKINIMSEGTHGSTMKLARVEIVAIANKWLF